MKTTPSLVLCVFVSTTALTCHQALADFAGGDSLASPSSNWQPVNPSGNGKLVFQNSRLEYLVKSPTTEDKSILRWTRNKGSYTRSWSIQVDVHLDTVSLNSGAYTNLNFGVVNSADYNQGYFIALDRYRERGNPGNYVSGVEADTADEQLKNAYAKSTATDVTLRVHFDSDAETITGSWSAGAAWKYFAPIDISGWNMGDSDTFTAALIGAGGGIDNTNRVGPVIRSGDAWFKNFKAGDAKPDITVEQPAGSRLADGSAKRNFGTAAIDQSVTRTFTIRNEGTAKLKGLAITTNGPQAPEFSVTGPAKTSLNPGASTTFKVTFSPKAAGNRSATIHIQCNDPDESPFDIKLGGEGAK